MISSEVKKEIRRILVDEYDELLGMYEVFERANQLKNAAEIIIAMDEVDIVATKLLGYAVSPFVALKRFH